MSEVADFLQTNDNVLGNYDQGSGLQSESLDWRTIADKVENGLMKGSKAYVLLRSYKSEIDDLIKAVENEVVNEVTAMDDKDELIVLGNKITHVKGRVGFEYKECSLWGETDKEKKRIEALIKTASAENVEIVDKVTGEIIEPVTIKHGKGYLKLEKA